MRSKWLLPLLLLVVGGLASTSCSNEVSGPTPSIEPDPETGQVTSPSFTCNEQVEGWVTVSGDAFSPLVVDTLDEAESVEQPTVTLTLSQTVEGNAHDGEPFSVVLEAADAEEETRVRWVDETTLEFRVDSALELPAGIYDVTVENANGEAATEPASFGVLPRPVVTAAQPDLVCVEQGARTVTVEGDFFLQTADGIPSIQIGDETYEPTELGDCRNLGDAFGADHQVCTTATIEVPEGDLGVGAHAVGVTNFEPAACASLPEEDSVNLVIVGPPSVDDIQPEPICSEQLEYDSMTITGSEFVRVGGEGGDLPTVTVNGTDYPADAASGCSAIDGLANQDAERCTELTFTIPADDLADGVAAGETFANLSISVTNPDPAGCESTEAVELTVVPPPTVADIQADPICTTQFDNEMTVTGTGFLTIDGTLPEVKVGMNTYTATAASDCTAVMGPATTVESCTTLTLTIPQGDFPTAQNYQVSVVNPADAACESQEDVQVTVVPPPSTTVVEPQPICTTDGDTTMTVTGSGFLTVDGTLPTVSVGMTDYTADAVSGCSDVAVQDDGNNPAVQTCDTVEFTIPQNDVPEGDYDVIVTNPDPASCSSTENSQLKVVPPATLTNIVEELACVAEGQRSFTLTGTGFLAIDGMNPTVQVGPNNTYTGTPSNCTSVTVATGATVEECTTLAFDVPQDDLTAGVYDVAVLNPAPAACVSSNTVALTISPPPTVAGVTPNPICTTQQDRSLSITGTDFLVVDGTVPTVTINGNTFTPTAANCSDVTSVTASTVQTCTELEVAVTGSDLQGGANSVTVTNPSPAGCTSTDTVEIFDVPPPSLSSVASDTTCVETEATTLTLTGSDFIKTTTALPTVTIGGQAANATAASNCTATGLTGVESCTELTVEVAQGLVAAGSHDIVVTNPGDADCSSTETVTLEVVGAPTVTDAQPDLFCNDTGDTNMTVTGTDFFVVNGTLPDVTVGGNTVTADAATNCTTVNAEIESCTSLDVTLPAQSLTAGPSDVSVTNPAPVGCSSSTNGSVLVAGPPVMSSISPMAICDDGSFSGQVTITGSNFLVINGNQPSVTLNGTTTVAIDSIANCTNIQQSPDTIDECTEIQFTVPSGMRGQDLDVSVSNPAPADCGSSALTLTVEPTPVVSGFNPLRVCTQTGGTVQINGQNFLEGASVEVGGVSFTDTDPTSNSDGVVVTSSQQIELTFPAGGLPPGQWPVRVTNPSGCFGESSSNLAVLNGASVVFVDPPVVYNAISTQVKIYTSGLQGASVTDVQITDSGGNVTSLTPSQDPSNPSVVQAVIPAGILTGGATSDSFDVTVIDDTGCSGTGQDLVTVTDDLGLSLEEIIPPFGWTDSTTDVTVTATDPAPAGTEQFQATPRLYLNPSNPQPGDVATELRSVVYRSDTELTAIVPKDLPTGTYDVVAVNPTGKVGVLQDAFDITAEAPPLIDSVSPGSWSTNETDLAVLIEGENFRQVDVTAECVDSDGNPVTAPVFDAANTTNTSTQINTEVDTSNLSHQDICVIRVTNTGDGTYAEFSPITIFNPAGKFVEFNVGPNLNVARRAPAGTNAVPTRTAQFIYGIGGDDGDPANGMRSIETSQLDRFGAPGAWWELLHADPAERAAGTPPLPEPRSLTNAVRVDDFVYLPGGHDGTGPTTDILRAEVLDPLFSPRITTVDLRNTEIGLDDGVYTYRISAVLDPSDPANPGGETLTSDPFSLRVPFAGFDITLSWNPPPGASNVVEYRIYRSPQPDSPFGTEELLAVVPGTQTTFTDDGSLSTNGEVPLELGSLGVWHKIADLQTARHSIGVAAAQDPVTAGDVHIYASGGSDGTTTLDSIEWLTIQVNGARDQTVSPGATADTTMTTAPLPVALSETTLVNGNSNNANRLSGQYLYAMGGRDSAGSPTRENHVALIAAGGDVASWTTLTKLQRVRSGHASAIANNNLVVAAGPGSQSATTADHVEICGPADGCVAPDIKNWSSLSNVLLRERHMVGYTSFRGFLYIYGGVNLVGTPLDTTDYSVMGGNP